METTNINRYTEYDKDHCWQYDVKLSTLEQDEVTYGIDRASIEISDLEFRYIDADDSVGCLAIRQFIERYEWLGKLPVWVTHRFAAYYDNIMIAAVILATPNQFSNLLGAEYKNREKLISRGATISFAPKNTASWIVMQSINWMVKNTDFVLFTAYADPSAKELGTIYQACNFQYLGNSFGGTSVYLNSNGRCFGSSYFSQRSVIKRAAIAYGIDWKDSYIISNATGSKKIINWNAIDERTKAKIEIAVNIMKASYKKVQVPFKHKYVYILGKTAYETRRLRKLFSEVHPELMCLSYPKERGL